MGIENVIGVSRPSKFSSKHNKEHVQKLAENLGICYIRIVIQEIVETYHRILEKSLEEIRKHFGVTKESNDPIADENINPERGRTV